MSSIRRRTRSNTSVEERQALVDEWERKEPTPDPPAGMPSAIPNFLLKQPQQQQPPAAASASSSSTDDMMPMEKITVKIEKKGTTTSNKRKRTRVIDDDDDDDDDSSVMIMEDDSKERRQQQSSSMKAAAPAAEVKVKLERNLSTIREEKKEAPTASTETGMEPTADSNNPPAGEDEEGDACAICFEEPPIDPATLDSCKHSFCFECIFRWSTEVASTCPLCKHDIHEITHYGAKEMGDDEEEKEQEEMMEDDEDVVILSKPSSKKGPSTPAAKPAAAESRKPIVVPIATKLQKVTWENNDENLPPEVRNARCQHCGNDNNEDQLLLCDGCDQAWHTYCVGLDKVPEGDFFCPQCEGEDDEDDDDEFADEEDEPKRKRLKRARDSSRGNGRRGRGRGRPRRDGNPSSATASSVPLPVEHPTRHQPSRVRQTSSLSTLSSPNDDFASQMAARLAGLAPPKPAVSAGMSARARLSVPSSTTVSSPFTAPLPRAAAAAAAAAAPSSSSFAASASSTPSYFSGIASVVPTTASPHARTKKTTVTSLEAAWNARNELMMQRERERFMAARREAREILKRQEEASRAKLFNATPRPRPLHSLAINAHAAANAASTSSPAVAAAASDWGSRLTPPPSSYQPNFRQSLSIASSSASKFKSNVAAKSRFTAQTSSSSPNSSNNAPLRRRIPKKFEGVQMKFGNSDSNPSSPSLGPNASPTGSFPSNSPFLQRHVSPSWGAAAAATAAANALSSYASRNAPASASKPPFMSSSSINPSSSQAGTNLPSRVAVAPASSLARIPSPVTTPTAAGRTSPFSATNGNWSNFGPAALKPRSASPPIPQKPQLSRPSTTGAAASSATAAQPASSSMSVAPTEAARFFPSAGPAPKPASPPLPAMLSFADFEVLYSGSDGDSTAPVTVGTHSTHKSHRPHSHGHSHSHSHHRQHGVSSSSSHDQHREERRKEKEARRAKERDREKQKARESEKQGPTAGSTDAAGAAPRASAALSSRPVSRPFTAAGQPVGIYQHPNHRQR